MSGGHFHYNQYRISEIAEEVENLCKEGGYSPETLEEFVTALDLLNKAYIYTSRIDWLVSGDDGEDSFHRRLKQELEALGAKT